jgi:quinol-cytochrome oxidoreductase complex cytochrome b subunit
MRIGKWIDYRMPIFSLMNEAVVVYKTPRNLNYWWNFGSLAGLALVIELATGIVLAMHYTPHVEMAFDSTERIMRDVNYGWLLRYVHANGGAAFFAVVYIHVFRGLYYGSYRAPRELLWWLGIFILLAMMATAFMGYVLPWGQMSFWAATVITNLFSAIPVVGTDVVEWMWGGFAVGNPTLQRFYSLHYLLPFVIVALVVLHLWALHRFGSNNPLGIETKSDKDSIPFHPYYTVKDLYGIGVFFIVFFAFVFFAPNYMGHPDNYIPADPLVTPSHIVPEWYFLPFYAVLRSATFDVWFLSAKLIGVILMFASILVLLALPWLDRSPARSARFRPVYKYLFWILVADSVILGIVGGKVPSDPVFSGTAGFQYVHLGQLATVYYFAHFLVIVPLLSRFEKTRPVPTSISEPVLKSGAGEGS